jgi:hypothetical protein
MSIRTRVMVGTLGLAVIGFVGSLGAAEDGTVIVRDGSVDLNVVNSSLDPVDKENEHKWSKKADTVEVFEDREAVDVCTTSKAPPVKFFQVELRIKDLTNRDKPRDVKIEVANEGWWVFGKLKFRMPGKWRFAFRAIDFRLVEGDSPLDQARAVTLEQVIITHERGEKPRMYPERAAPETFLCVKFVHR